MPLFYTFEVFILALFLLIIPSSFLFANSNININGQSYSISNSYSSGNGSVSVVNGIVVDGQNISGNNGTRGNNRLATEKRSLPGVTQLQVEITANIDVILSNSSYIEITSDENIIPLILSQVKNNRLFLSSKKNFWTQNAISIKLFVNQLDEIYINGSANLKMHHVSQNNMLLMINGTGDMNITGQVRQLQAEISGSGDMDLDGLQAQSAHVSISGSGDINVRASQSLNAAISGSGDINYSGRPQHLKKFITGSGDIDASE